MTPASAAASAMSATISRSSMMEKPSSRTKAAEIHWGRAPIIDRSLTVPQMARWPMDPPGKRRGLTTNESVEKAMRSPDGSSMTAPSDMPSRVLLRNASRNTASMSAADALPPAPWAELMNSSFSLGRRLRNSSIRCMTCSSRSPPPCSPPCGHAATSVMRERSAPTFTGILVKRP